MTANEHPLTCKELVELVTEYLEGTLPAHDRARFDSHLAVCEGCTHYVEQMRETVRLTGRLSEEALSTDAKDKLLGAFRKWKSGG